MAEIVRTTSAQEAETSGLLDVSEIVSIHVATYAELEKLALQQKSAEELNPELFEQIQSKLDLAREVWRKRYELVAHSVATGNLDWSKSRESKDHFWYTLLVNEEPAIQFLRSDIYDGDIEIFDLSIAGPHGSASSHPELVDQDRWSRYIRYYFRAASIYSDHVQYVDLNFEEVLVKNGVPKNWHHQQEMIHIKGERVLKPANVSRQDAFGVPQVGQSFELTAQRLPHESATFETSFLSRPR